MHVDDFEEFARDGACELLRVVAFRVAGEFAIEVELVDWSETPILRIGSRIGDREEQEPAADRHGLQGTIELENDLGPGRFVTVDRAADADRRSVTFACNLMDRQNGVGAVGIRRE